MSKNEEIKEAVETDNIKSIESFNLSELLSFEHDEYNNIFLFVARRGSTKVLKKIVSIIESDIKLKEQWNDLINSRDHFGRNALALTSISNNIESMKFLHKTLQFDINDRDRKNRSALWFTIDRNCVDAFEYLLLEGAIFSKEEEIIINENKEFKKYFNSPRCFLIIIKSNNERALKFILRHIKTQSNVDIANFMLYVNNDGKNALQLAKECGNEKILKKVEELTLFTTKKDKKEIANSITSSPNNFKQEGRVPKKNPTEKERHYHSYSNNREVQLLRHVATQLYFSLNKKLKKKELDTLVELQIMHLNLQNKNCLFIAVNEHNLQQSILSFIKNKETLQKMLTSVYKPSDTEGNERSKRFSSKLLGRIYSDELNLKCKSVEDAEHTIDIANILREGIILPLTINMEGNELSSTTKKVIKFHMNNHFDNIIYIVVTDNCQHKLRHSEEFLVDIAEYVKRKAEKSKKDLYTCIAGKKRPCMSCSGRMEGIINKYNRYPGRFWVNTLENQASNSASRTIQLLLRKPSSITVCKDKSTLTREYNSGSDTEVESAPPSP